MIIFYTDAKVTTFSKSKNAKVNCVFEWRFKVKTKQHFENILIWFQKLK